MKRPLHKPLALPLRRGASSLEAQRIFGMFARCKALGLRAGSLRWALLVSSRERLSFGADGPWWRGCGVC